MSRSTLAASSLLVASLLVACAELGAPFPAGRFTGIDRFDDDPYVLDRLLEWPGDRDGTLGPTGDRLFADRLAPAPGLVGRFGFLHDTDALPDLVRLSFEVDDAPTDVEGFQPTWRPSHGEAAYRVGPFVARERKYVTQDDVAVVTVALRNESAEEHAVTVRVSSPAAPLCAFADGSFRPVDLTLATNRAPGLAPLEPRPTVGGVPFETVAPSKNAGRTLVQVGGDHPPFLEVPVRREAVRVHALLVAPESVAAVPSGILLATLQVFYAEGRPVVAPLRAGLEVRPGRNLVTIETSPRRTIAYLRLEAADGPPSAIPALAAVTLEEYAEPVAPQAVVAERLLFDAPVRQAMVADVRRAGRVVEHARVVDFGALPHALVARVAVPAGEDVELRVAHALGLADDDVRARADSLLAEDDPFERHLSAYHAFFRELAPRFRSGDDAIDAVWWYRWFLVRRALVRPGQGLLPGRAAVAGRHGADLTRIDPAASAAFVLEARWLRDPEIARDAIRAHVATAAPDGRFVAARVDTRQEPVPHRLAAAAEALDQVHPDRAFLREVVPALAADVEATARRLLETLRSDADPRPARDALANARATERLARRIGLGEQAEAMGRLARRIAETVPAAAEAGTLEDGGAAFADALAAAAPEEVEAALVEFARRHLASTDPPRVILREPSDPRTGAVPGRPDVLRSTFVDLVWRFADDVDWPRPWSSE